MSASRASRFRLWKGGEIVYRELGKVVSEAMQSWGKTVRLCLLVAVVAAAAITGMYVG